MRCLVGRAPCSATCSGSRAGAGSPSWSCRAEERESVDRRMRQIEFLDVGDRRGRAADREGGARLGGDQAPDDRSRRERDRRRDLPRRDRRHLPLREPAQARRLPRAGSTRAPVGLGPATHGRISKQGSVRARHALVEASWTTVRQPGAAARVLRADPRATRALRSRSSPARESSRACSGVCSRARRTTPTRSRR